jgi:hypothetical protein
MLTPATHDTSNESRHQEPKPSIQENDSIEYKIAHERIRQAKNTSNLALGAAALTFFISVCGAGALLSGKVPEGSVTTASGLLSSFHCIRLAKDANDRMDKLLAELNDDS